MSLNVSYNKEQEYIYGLGVWSERFLKQTLYMYELAGLGHTPMGPHNQSH